MANVELSPHNASNHPWAASDSTIRTNPTGQSGALDCYQVMKYTIELEVDSFGAASSLVEAQRKVAKHNRKIWSSAKSRKQLLQLFNDDFEEFISFVCAAERLSQALQHVAMTELDQKKPQS